MKKHTKNIPSLIDILEEDLEANIDIAESAGDILKVYAESLVHQVKLEIAVQMDNQKQKAQAAIAANISQWGNITAYTTEGAIKTLIDLTEDTFNYIVDKQLDSDSPLPENLLKAESERLNIRHEKRIKDIEKLEGLENQRKQSQAGINADRVQWRVMKAYITEGAIKALINLTEDTFNYIVDKQLDSDSPLPENLLKAESERLNIRHEKRIKDIEKLEGLENQRKHSQAGLNADRIQWRVMKAYLTEKTIRAQMDQTERTLNHIVDEKLDSESRMPDDFLKTEIERMYDWYEKRIKGLDEIEFSQN